MSHSGTNRLPMALPAGNFLIDVAAVSQPDLLENAKVVTLRQTDRTTLSDVTMLSVDFPLTALLSVIGVLADGATCEVASVGAEGFVEIDAALRSTIAKRTAICSVSGDVIRVPLSDFQRAIDNRGSFADLVYRAVRARIFITEQIGFCNARHTVNQRFARWLLLSSVRLGRSDLPITHEYIAGVLGVTRPTISLGARMHVEANAIELERGAILVKDRGALEAIACECYRLCADALRDVHVPAVRSAHA